MGLPRNLLYIIRTSFPVRAGIDYPLLHLSPARLSFVVAAYGAYYHGLRPFLLVFRSSKAVNKGTPPMPWGLLLSAPHPRFRSAVELQVPNPRCSLDLFCVREGSAR
jgi:hypothetical protein